MATLEKIILIISTAPSEEVAAVIGRKLVEARQAACVNIVPRIRSIYTWKNEIHDEQECLMILKTCESKSAEASKALRSLHPYEVPEILILPITDALPEYVEWVLGATKKL